MRFSIAAFSTTVVAVVLSGVASYRDGTLTSGRVVMGFLNHGGMWGDLVIMSTVSGLIFPHIEKNWLYALPASLIAIAITIVAHAQWATWSRSDGVTEHVFPSIGSGKWYVDISAAGWIHVGVMSALITLILLYTVSSTPKTIVIAVSILLTAHVFLAIVQPGWYCTGKLWTWKNFGPPLILTLLTWVVAALKIQRAKGNF